MALEIYSNKSDDDDDEFNWSNLSDIDDPSYVPEVQKGRTLNWVYNTTLGRNLNVATTSNSQQILNESSNEISTKTCSKRKKKISKASIKKDKCVYDFSSSSSSEGSFVQQKKYKTRAFVGNCIVNNIDDNKKATNCSDITSDITETIIQETSDESSDSSNGSFTIPYISPYFNKRDNETLNEINDNNEIPQENKETNIYQEVEHISNTAESNSIEKENTIRNYINKALGSKKKKKRTICKFCKISVTNFERHLRRHHVEEREVQEYSRLPKNTKEGKQMRRNILSLLRYETEFQNYLKDVKADSKKLPCSHCRRLIAVNYLRRHFKKCIVKPINETGKHIQHRAASQTLVACASEHANINSTLRVKNEVYSRMATDNIGFLARTDSLIRHFGEYYLKKHKRAQISVACSNKMRECSRLLIELRRRIGKSNFSFFEMLDPVLFDDVILSAKAISGYNDEKKNYSAPSLALHIGTTLQQICGLTTHLLLKRSPEYLCENLEAKLKEVKRFRFLVQTQWSNEVSSLALKDLTEKKWNKPVLLPLTKDIIAFRNHILDVAKKCMACLKNDRNDVKSYKTLVDCSLAFTILFNRRRIGDVQYVEIESYLKSFQANNQSEYLEELTESEKALTTSYKRVVAGGKGSRAIVILFSPIVQEYIALILKIRNETNIVPEQNKYLFAYPGVTDQWIRGDIVLKKFAKTSKISNPEAMTSNKLRKQIATLMQIMNLPKNEYSQFSKFMGHTEKTHKEFYEITQDAYQTAKVGKLLCLFDQGKGAEYKNKDFEHIDIDPNKIFVESEDEDSDTENKIERKDKGEKICNIEMKNINDIKESLPGTSTEVQKDKNGTKEKKKKGEILKNIQKTSNRVRWTEQQKKLVSSYFKNHINMKITPKKDECIKLIVDNPDLLHNLDWPRVKTFVYNSFTQKRASS